MVGDRKNIWLVEDDKSTRVVINLELKKTGHNILEFFTVDDALAALQNKDVPRPDLIITDNNTGSEKDGAALITAAKTENIKSILMSAESKPKDSEKSALEVLALRLGAEAFFNKAESGYVKKLRGKVEELLGQGPIQSPPNNSPNR